jgi:hypothetical protein
MLSINKISELTRIDRRTIKKRLAGIVPIKRTPGGVFYSESALEIVRRGGGRLSQARDDLRCDRLRTQIAKARFELAVEQGAMVLVSEAEQWVAGVVMNARQRFLALSRKLAPHCVGLDSAQVAVIIEDAIREILDGLANEPRPTGLRRTSASAQASGQRPSTPIE